MPAEITSLSELNTAAVTQNYEKLRRFLSEDNTSLDLVGGVIDEVLVFNGAALATVNQANLDLLDQSGSLLKISEDPALADDNAVDKVLSNFNITRKTGSAATGSVKIVVNRLTTITIANGATFTANGRTFFTPQSYVARTSSANVTSASDRVLTPLADGNYGFTIEVIDSEVGADGQLSKDTLLIPQSAPLYFVKALAAGDFTGGVNEETNEQLIARLAEGAAVKALSGPVTMKATLRSRDGFENVLQSSIIGMGDSAQLRDKHWIWPSGGGGKVDWYVRTQERVKQETFEMEAILVEKTFDGFGIWQLNINKSVFPGFYEVTAVQPIDAVEATGGYDIVEDVRGINLTDEDNAPDVVTAAEVAYTSYQTAVVRFKDDETVTDALAINDTKTYSVTLAGIPLIREIQDSMGARNTRNAAGDLLIKAPVPCFLKVSFTADVPEGAEEPDTATIADALASAVNNYGFSGRLPASKLTDIIHNYLPTGGSVSGLDLFGRIRRPDGTFKFIRSSALLTVPDEPENMVTGRTVVFYLDPADVAISIVRLAVLDV